MSNRADIPDRSQFYDDAPVARAKPTGKSAEGPYAHPRKRAIIKLPYSRPDERYAARLDEWCHAYGVSEQLVNRLRREGKGPKIIMRGAIPFVRKDDWYAWWDIDIPPRKGRGRQDLRRASAAATAPATEK